MDSRSLAMTNSVPDSEFCLPAEFLTGEEEHRVSDSIFNFPIEFPYEFHSSALVDSTETESSGDDEEDDLVSGLTRFRLTQKLAVHPKMKTISSGSPKSTLCGIGSWSMSSSSNGSTNGEISPPTTPPGARCEKPEPVYAGAGEVFSDRRFVYSVSQLQNQDRFDNSYSVWGTQQLKTAPPHLQQNQIQNRGTSSSAYQNGRFVRPLGLPQSAWPPLQVQQNKFRSPSSFASASVDGSGAKRGCAGTGVFLPRRFDDSTQIKRSAKVEDIDRQSNNYQSFNGAFASKHDYSSMTTTTNGLLLAQQKGNLPMESAVKYEFCLPQERIY